MSAIAACSTDSAQAVELPDFYGKANLSLMHSDSRGWALASNASRLGIKGKIDLIEQSLWGIYKAEYEVYFDTGANSKGAAFKARNIYAGLANRFGELFFGKNDSALKLAQGKIDVFNDITNADIKVLIPGENRSGNMININSAEFYGFQARFQTILQENKEDGKTGLFDSYSGSLTYQNNHLTTAIAYDRALENFNNLRLAGQYEHSLGSIGGLYQYSENNPGKGSGHAWFISATVKPVTTLPQWSIFGRYGQTYQLTPTEAGQDNNKLYGLGSAWKLGKPGKIFAYWTALDTDKTDNTIGLGYELKF